MTSNLIATGLLALMLVWVTRHERGYAWWKAVLVAAGGGLASFLIGNAAEAGRSVLGDVSNWLGIVLVLVVVSFLFRVLLAVSWRDASLLSVAFIVLQVVVAILMAIL